MIALQHIQKVFLIGIGGMGMSALARYFQAQGCKVAGYDRSRSPLTEALEASGMAVYDSPAIPAADWAADLVIYTPAIGRDHPVFVHYLNEGIPVYKRSEVLEEILKDMRCIAVAGSHGKTTISCMIAHLLHDSGLRAHAFLGGISANYGTNYLKGDQPLAVVEADEYDRSFLRLHPDVAVITAMDSDHLDIYETQEQLQDAFRQFSHQIRPGGLLVHKTPAVPATGLGGDRKWSYSLTDPEARITARAIRPEEGGYHFTAVLPGQDHSPTLQLPMGGLHNVENALAAIAVGRDAGLSTADIRAALASFKGVKRRFEYRLQRADKVYIDDYAHHPEELRMLLKGVRALFPQAGLTLVFQPHLYSRTRDMAAAFAEVLQEADRVILLPVYPAREAPIPGVDSGLIAGMLPPEKVQLCEKAELLTVLTSDPHKVVVTAGAGDIGDMSAAIANAFNESAKSRS